MSTGRGVIIVIAMTLVVFTILFLSMIMLKAFGKWLIEMKQRYSEHKLKKAAKLSAVDFVEEVNREIPNNEELAAITLALHAHLNANRDEESEIITIEMPAARYSPWAQKNLIMKRVERR